MCWIQGLYQIIICDYFVRVCGFSFHSHNNVFQRADFFFILMNSISSFLKVDHAFGIICKNSAQLNIFKVSFMVLCYSKLNDILSWSL